MANDTPIPSTVLLRVTTGGPVLVETPAPRVELVLTLDNERLSRVTQLLEEILTRVTRLAAQREVDMATVADIQAKLDAIHTDVESETDIVTSVQTLLEGNTAMIAGLKTQLDAAIAGQDPAALQAVSDALDTIANTNTANKARLVAAVVANTPAAEPPAAVE